MLRRIATPFKRKFVVALIFAVASYCSTVAAQSPGSFTPTGPMNQAREQHRATLLPNGKVLITGGTVSTDTADTLLSSAELYDPSTGTFTLTGELSVPRDGHEATLLGTGQVLITGGYTQQIEGGRLGLLASAELYDPSTETFTPTGEMTVARAGHTATLLSNGQVLIAGGFSSNDQIPAPIEASAELYDPSTGTFTPTGAMAEGRVGHTATLLSSGRVLIAGGTPSESFLNAEIYDPDAGTFSTAGRSPYAFTGPLLLPASASLLPNGQVLFTLAPGDDTSDAAALFDPSTGTFSPTGNATTFRFSQTSTLLADGTVLITGLNYGLADVPEPVSHADLYDPATGVFSPTGNMTVGRIYNTATLLPDGTVLLAGGARWSPPAVIHFPYRAFLDMDSAEVFQPGGKTQ